MNCDWTKDNVVLYVYNELADDAKFEFEQHVRHCLGCRRELEAALALKDGMAAAPVKDVSPSFLAANPNQVQIKYNTLQPQILNGSSDDPRIRQLLVLAARNTRNPAIALDSIDVLTHGSEDNAVREVLIEALRYDKNPGVRLKSLDALKGYVRDDVHVRDAVVEALLHDNNAGVRQEAISLLEPVKADTSVRTALTVLAAREPNKFIREESKRYLASMPHLD